MKIHSPSRSFVAAALALASTPLLSGCNYTYGTGKFVGNVVKFGVEGMICKTWEGEMAIANLRGARSGGSGNTLDFNVKDPDVINKLKKAQDGMAIVEVEYIELGLSTPCAQSNSHIIVGVKEIASGNVSPFSKLPQGEVEEKELPGPDGKQARKRLDCVEVAPPTPRP